jgi:hypothetical protein
MFVLLNYTIDVMDDFEAAMEFGDGIGVWARVSSPPAVERGTVDVSLI